MKADAYRFRRRSSVGPALDARIELEELLVAGAEMEGVLRVVRRGRRRRIVGPRREHREDPGLAGRREDAGGRFHDRVDDAAHLGPARVGPGQGEVDDDQGGALAEAHGPAPSAPVIPLAKRVQVGPQRAAEGIGQAQVVGAEREPLIVRHERSSRRGIFAQARRHGSAWARGADQRERLVDRVVRRDGPDHDVVERVLPAGEGRGELRRARGSDPRRFRRDTHAL